MNKEEHAIILEYLPNGYPLEGRTMPIAQAIGKKELTLLELVPRRGVTLEIGEEVYIGEGMRDKVYHLLGKLASNKTSEVGQKFLPEWIENQIKVYSTKLEELNKL